MLESCWVVFSLTERTEFTELLAHVSSPQNASGIQSSQSVSAIVDAEQGATRSLHPAHRGISVITPLPLGEGKGEGPLTHRTPPAYRVHRAFKLKVAVRFCEIG